ncbi:MAG: ABC transporter ATP-binding protein [Elusimicrobiota bacterium]
MKDKNILLAGKDIKKKYIPEDFLGTRRKKVIAVDGVSFKIREGEILGIVGESGSGKSTLARLICGLEDVSSGELNWKKYLDNRKVYPAQMVFQNPYNSLNPKLKIGYILKEALRLSHSEIAEKAVEKNIKNLLREVGLPGVGLKDYPHQLSGGQKQRVVIARALALTPKLLVCDEPVSALDISVQAQIVKLLKKLNREENLSIVFIAHDIEIVGAISENIAVMKEGEIVEYGTKEKILKNPDNEYTKKLIEAVPRNPWI